MEYEVLEENGIWNIQDVNRKYNVDLRARLFKFAIDNFKFLKSLPFNKEYDVFRYQLSKSTTSMGANYEEAQGAVSRREFSNKIGICLKESKETNYFYRIIQALDIGDKSECSRLVIESDELQKIFGSISVKIRKSINKHK